MHRRMTWMDGATSPLFEHIILFQEEIVAIRSVSSVTTAQGRERNGRGLGHKRETEHRQEECAQERAGETEKERQREKES